MWEYMPAYRFAIHADVKRAALKVLKYKYYVKEAGIYLPQDDIHKFLLHFGSDGLLIEGNDEEICVYEGEKEAPRFAQDTLELDEVTWQPM
jgi:hypothetical protein